MSDLIVDTNQEAFDFVVRHFIKQRTRASMFGQCLYRAPDGKRCAVGALIKDSSYRSEMEGKAVIGLDGLLDFGYVSVPFLRMLQAAHDDARHGLVTGTVCGELASAAAKFNLDTAVLDAEYLPLVTAP